MLPTDLRPDWWDDAACRGEGLALWFEQSCGHSEGCECRGRSQVDRAEGQRICLGCPVRVTCLEAALREGEREGTWGGIRFGRGGSAGLGVKAHRAWIAGGAEWQRFLRDYPRRLRQKLKIREDTAA